MIRQLTQHELLDRLACSPNTRSYLEVGVQEGKSLMKVLAHGHVTRVALCDTWGSVSGGSGRGDGDHIRLLLNGLILSKRPIKIDFLDGDSKVQLPLVNDRFDLVHIDGGHDYETALSDMREGWRVCMKTMVVHDVSMPEVWRALFEFGRITLTDESVRIFFGGHGTAVIERAQELG